MNAAEQAQFKKLQAYATERHLAAQHRVNALNEIENLAAFDLSAEEMRAEIKRITGKCKKAITAGVSP